VLRLGEVRGRILDRANLTVAAEAFRNAEARGRVVQAAQPPNPYVMLRQRRISNFQLFNTGFGELEVGIPIELGHKRSARVRQAMAEASAVSEEVRVVTANTLRDAELAFYRALRISLELQIARDQAKVAIELRDLAEVRYKEGRDGRVPALRFSAAADDASLDVQDLERRYERACRTLDELVGAPSGSTQRVEGTWARGTLTDFDRREARVALERHPRRRAVDRAAAAAERAVARADADVWPNLVVGVQGERDFDLDRDYVGISFLVPVPLFDKNQGNRAFARAKARRAHTQVQAEALRLSVELDQALIAYDRASRNAEGFQDDILPTLQQSLDLARKAYEAGRSTYLDVLDALGALYRARRTRIRHLEEQAQAAVIVHYLTEPA
jgi:cobalt-zinc-cadmium efflux system outer membrane protein